MGREEAVGKTGGQSVAGEVKKTSRGPCEDAHPRLRGGSIFGNGKFCAWGVFKIETLHRGIKGVHTLRTWPLLVAFFPLDLLSSFHVPIYFTFEEYAALPDSFFPNPKTFWKKKNLIFIKT